MKARKLSAGIWAVVVLLSGLGMLGILSVPVVAPPNMHFFSGSITLNGVNAPIDTEVYAEIDGTVYGQDSIFGGTGGYDGSVYSLTVAGEDAANTSAKEGGINGERIIFWVVEPGGRPYIANQAPVYTDGNVDTLNLVVQSVNQPNMVRFNQVAPVNVSDWVDLYNPDAASNVVLSPAWGLEDSYGGSWAFGVGDILPPMGTSPAPHSVNLLDADGNIKLVWTDPLATIAQGNPVVMDKVEWGPHIGDTETSKGDTIGLDKGDGSVWDPNLANVAPDDGYIRIDMTVDTDTAADWYVGHPGAPNQKPQLWPSPGGYLNPVVGDPSTMFVWDVKYADIENDAPQVGSPEIDIYSIGLGPLPGSPFAMSFVGWEGANGDYTPGTGGAWYTFQTTLGAATDWCYEISATDTAGLFNTTGAICDPDVTDNMAPLIEDVLVNGLPEIFIAAGTSVDLTTSVNDTTTGGSNIGGSQWNFTCAAPWNPMSAQDGTFDEPDEVGFDAIDTTGWPDGVYYTYIQAWDVVPNMNTSCPFATINIVTGDTFAPEIFEPRVDGQTQVTVAPGAMVTFTAVVDDSNRGNSNVTGANYTVNMPPQLPMTAADLAFDEPNETVTADINTAGWNHGAFDICVSDAWDEAGNHNTLGSMCAIINVDATEPTITFVRLDGIANSHSVAVGSTTKLTATISDATTGGSNINNASFSFDGALGIAMHADPDDIFDNPTENVYYDIVTGVAPYLEGGPYYICISGSDVLGNDNTNGGCIWLNITGADDDPPVVSNPTVDGQPSKTILANKTFTFNGTVDDTTTGPSDIANASYIVRDSSGATHATDIMDPEDGIYDEIKENVTASIDTSGWPKGAYTVRILACDVIPNCNYDEDVWATVTLVYVIPDNVPPEISNAQADTTTFREGDVQEITVTATVDDTNTGGSKIGGATYSVNGGTPLTMQADDGAFDEVSELVTVTIDVGGWTSTVGTYEVYIFGSDEYGNNNDTSTEHVTITVQPQYVGNPPVIGTPSYTPSEPKEGDEVTITVTVTDVETVAANLTVTITVTDPDGTAVVTNVAMTLSTGDTFTYTTPELDDEGTYTYIITAVDEADNDVDKQGTFDVKAVAGPEIELWVWILLIIIIIVIILLIAFLAMRKKPEEEIPPEMPPEEEIPLEEEVVEEEVVEEMPPEEEVVAEEVVEEAPVEEAAPVAAAPMEEAEAVVEEAAPAGPKTCPNCGTSNPEGISVCTSCGSPL